ncbi:beta-carotene isomerase D27 chloroplastic isoform X1 [Prunus yedoensis var. nudiflora]|uniref:Beta-carotene isomerase D27 chloroplastic isoform X1 n=1 Tax=Prunus yedoensis var. nudiflora TaxID=2094558 RepID=A0A314Y0E9_PRUYE|nr:beta-carotene isomerase D27 chloroplastic isoform X1 [Prunus yedoensis var. nudiflora]
MGQKTKYNDGFFEKGFMTLFARKMKKFTAPVKARTETKEKAWWEYDYESFVDVSKRVMQGREFSSSKWFEKCSCLCCLQFRKLFPPTKWAAEFNAALTVPFFSWLVGPSELPFGLNCCDTLIYGHPPGCRS